MLYSIFTGVLTERKQVDELFCLLIVIACLCLISISKLIDKKTFTTVFSSLFRVKKINKINFIDSINIHPVSSFLMALNCFFSLSLCIYICLKHYYINDNLFLFSSLAALISLFIPVFSFVLLTLILGDKKLKKNGLFVTIRTFEFSGIFFLILNLSYFSSTIGLSSFIYTLFTIYLLAYIHRSIKLSLKMINSGFLWYHLILYLCTLEFIPFAVLASIYSRNLIG